MAVVYASYSLRMEEEIKESHGCEEESVSKAETHNQLVFFTFLVHF